MTHKDKILKYLENKGVKPTDFYKICGFSNGFLDSGKSFGADKLAIILDNYQDLSVDWLLFDRGNMIATSDMMARESAIKYNKRPSIDGIIEEKIDYKIVGLNQKIDELSKAILDIKYEDKKKKKTL